MGCELCPRACGALRADGAIGYCGESAEIRVAKAYLHLWEEPCLVGEHGSGTVFFSGCNLGCVFCQNREISRGGVGFPVTTERLAEIFLSLEEKGAANINLVTATQFSDAIPAAVCLSRERGMTLPVVYNCGGYESVDALRKLEGYIDVYMPDFKYLSPTLSARYSGAVDYFDVAAAALEEMVRQCGDALYRDGIMMRGVIVRHLLLPGCLSDSRSVLNYLYKTYGNRIKYSLMSQYTPPVTCEYPELLRTVTPDEYFDLCEYAAALGIENAYIQDGSAARESFVPHFDGEGVVS